MATITVPIASGTDDGYVARDGSASYPPSTSTTTSNADIFSDTSREWTAGSLFRIFNTLLRFDTGSVLLDSAIVNSASLIVDVLFISNADTRNLTADYYTWDGTTADYSAASQTGAITAYSLSSITTGLNSIPLTGLTSVSTTGMTSIRLHVDGGQPTGRNIMEIATLEHTTAQEPRLAITYTLPNDYYLPTEGLGKKKRTSTF